MNIDIKDSCGLIRQMNHLANMDFTKEHCALGLANAARKQNTVCCDITEYCMVEDYGGKTTTQYSFIPKSVLASFLRICRDRNLVPVVMHTHIIGYEHSKPLGFSPQDEEFMKKFINYSQKWEYAPLCIFLLSNGEDLQVYINDIIMKKKYRKAKISWQ